MMMCKYRSTELLKSVYEDDTQQGNTGLASLKLQQ